jgi:hypothetical protein
LLWEHDVAGSNPATPTILIGETMQLSELIKLLSTDPLVLEHDEIIEAEISIQIKSKEPFGEWGTAKILFTDTSFTTDAVHVKTQITMHKNLE